MTSDIDIDDLEGVGPTTADRLRDGGYTTIKQLSNSDPEEIEENVNGVGETKAESVVEAARDKDDAFGFNTALERFNQDVDILKTGIEEVDDEVMDNGLRAGNIFEFYGEFGSGKSQAAKHIAAQAVLPEQHGGLGCSVAYVDTEDSFRAKRIRQMLMNREDEVIVDSAEMMDMELPDFDGDVPEDIRDRVVDNLMERIFAAKAMTSDLQEDYVSRKLPELQTQLADTDLPRVRVVVIDSLTANYRSEFVGRGELAERQQRIGKHLQDLTSFCDTAEALGVITNQVSANPDSFFGDPTQPIGGNIIGHTSTYRIYIKKKSEPNRTWSLQDSPDLPQAEAEMKISDYGLEGL